jgi:hypothetical protein
MQLTFGDVLFFVAGLIGLCISVWGLVLGVALFFPMRCSGARSSIQVAPWKSLLLGLLLVGAFGFVGLALLGNPAPAAKLVGWMFIVALLAIGAIGAGGMALLAAERLRPLDDQMSEYGAISRGALILVVAGLVPFLGWFFIAPLAMAISVGSGVQVLFARSRQRIAEPA